jgi:hypothetical protein
MCSVPMKVPMHVEGRSAFIRGEENLRREEVR